MRASRTPPSGRPARRLRLGLVLAACAAGVLALAAAGAADTPPGGTVLTPTMFEAFPGPTATISVDFHADCSGKGTNYIVADAFNEDGKQVASSGTRFRLDGPVPLVVTIDNGSWTEEFVIQVTLHCSGAIVPAGQTEVTVTDGKRQAEIALRYWEVRVKQLKAALSALNDPGADLKWAKAFTAAELAYADGMRNEYQTLVDDPVDKLFRVVALPRPKPALHLSGPSTGPLNQLSAALTKVEALAQALVASIDRVSGARKAGDRTALRTQRNAVALYARQTLTLTGSLPTLVRHANSAASKAAGGPAREIARAHALSVLGSPAFATTLKASTVALQQIGRP